MKRNILITYGFILCTSLGAQNFTEWQDPAINEINRADMHTHYFAYQDETSALKGYKEDSQNFMTLNGKWKFLWVKDADKRPKDFFKVNYDDNSWGHIPVPGMWALNGYGEPLYVNNGYAWQSVRQ